MGKITKQSLFIVGLARSGTTLLRDLLNNHPKVKLSQLETRLFPYMDNLIKGFGNLKNKKNFKKFYNRIVKTTYFLYQDELKIKKIDAETWYNRCKEFTTAEIFKQLILHDIKIEENDEIIWGDKTPSYISNVKLIKQTYPNAKIVHIIRDVRDVCLSNRKRWGNNIYRVANKWDKKLKEFHKQIKEFKEDVYELEYESLLKNTKEQVKNICIFLNIDYKEGMEKPSRITEIFGDAKNLKKIKKDNLEKFLKELEPKEILKIESIAYYNLKKFEGNVLNYLEN
ncbi:hypothetical protein LCGC14_1221270 [marine sediment metagenome]|uniref:Sulfotransferase domain-containing protein n=1 Tax=marine sediment metagenome TaxID=412755 RepID=A0A0F9PFP1_9ZZZZ